MIQIDDKSKCCGCSACVSVCPKKCISLHEDSEGFLYPTVNKNLCVDCGLCEKVCPIINQAEPKRPEAVYAAINPNEEIRLASSSGGIFSMLAERIISRNGVVFGARFDENWEVVHDYCETIEGLAAFRGSKYVQSKIEDSYVRAEEFLKSGREVLFSGTPCQIAGLHKFLRKDYAKLLTIDVVCHGVPSPSVWRAYIKEIKICPQGVAGKNTVLSSLNKILFIKGISFRDKTDGWKKYGFAVRGCADQGEAHQNSVLPSNRSTIEFREFHGDNLFMQGFLRDIILRPSCYACPAKAGRAGSDITLADYWGIDRHHPKMDDDGGTSLVLLNTPKGAEMYHSLSCRAVATTYEQALSGNPSMERSVVQPAVRRYFYRKFSAGHDVATIKKAVEKMRPSFMDRVKFNLRRVVKRS